MLLYGIKTCDTCRKALKALEAAGKDATFVDVRTEAVSPETLSGWFEALGPALVNRRSTTWKELSEADRAKADSADGAIALMKTHPTLMKRPVIEADGKVTLGWTKGVMDEFGV